jgi:hypothetical protein
MNMTKDELIDRIHQVFQSVSYPGDHAITVHPLGLDENIEPYFRGTTWQGHSIEKLRFHLDAIGVFTPEGYHYFLPAFMLAALQDQEDIGWHIGFSLERGSGRSSIQQKTKEEFFIERMRLFSKEQIEVLKDFFNYLLAEDDDRTHDYHMVILNLSEIIK